MNVEIGTEIIMRQKKTFTISGIIYSFYEKNRALWLNLKIFCYCLCSQGNINGLTRSINDKVQFSFEKSDHFDLFGQFIFCDFFFFFLGKVDKDMAEDSFGNHPNQFN